MTRRRNVLDQLADRVMDLDSRAYGDERERAVFTESTTFGLTMGLYAALTSAVVLAVLGQVLLPVALLVITLVPALAAIWYAKRRGVDLSELADRAGARSTMVNVVVVGAGMALAFAAMTWTVWTGHGLVTVPAPDVTPGEGFWGGLVQGAVVGGFLGSIGAIVGGVASYRRTNRRRSAP